MGLALPAFTSSMERTKKREKEIRKDKIMAAAEMYIADHKFNIFKDYDGSEYFISVNKLISEGYLSSGDIKGFKEGEGVTYANGGYTYNGSEDGYSEEVGFSVGDYVSMVPTYSGSYSIVKNKTGYTADQSITPSELTLWRVIRINDDKTIDLVSEYASSDLIYFSGSTGYKKLASTLNEIASKYENSQYTVKSRHFGYNNQSAPTSLGCSSNNNNSIGCSSVVNNKKYEVDYNLVTEAIGTAAAYKVGTEEKVRYWTPSIGTYYTRSGNTGVYRIIRKYFGILIDVTGDVVGASSTATDSMLYYASGPSNTTENWTKTNRSVQAAIRPIITLKAGFKCNLYVKSSIDNPCMIVPQ